MRLTDIAARIFGKGKGHEVLPPLERSSTELTRARLTTRRNSLENSHFVPDYAHEELHTVCPREDSIKLAKQRLSHEHEPYTSQPSSLDWEVQADQEHHVHWASPTYAVCSS